MNPDIFWDLSLMEIIDYLRCSYKRQKQDLKQKISLDFILAEQIGANIAKVIGGNDVQIPKVWDIYPTLFEEEKQIYEKNRIKADMEKYKAQMTDYIIRHNARFK